LVDRAKLREPRLPDETRARVHQSVLHRIAALGAATAATTSAGLTAKAGVLGAGVVTHLIASGIAGGLTGAALIVALPGSWIAPVAHPERPAPALMQSAAHRDMRTDPPTSGRQNPPSSIAAPSMPISSLPSESAPAGPPPDARDATSEPPSRLAGPPPRVRNDVPARVPASSSHTASSLGDRPKATPAVPAPDMLSRASELATDLEIMQRVHSALSAGQPEQALALLLTREAVVHTGVLDEEAAGARIAALCQLGRMAAAQAATNTFLLSWPRSPLSMKVREGCSCFAGSKGDRHR
jgi:hypothetical protein